MGLCFPAVLQIYLSAYGSDFTAHPLASTGSHLSLSLSLSPTCHKGAAPLCARSGYHKSATLPHKAAKGMTQQILRKRRINK